MVARTIPHKITETLEWEGLRVVEEDIRMEHGSAPLRRFCTMLLLSVPNFSSILPVTNGLGLYV
jgi:hypothetical protein